MHFYCFLSFFLIFQFFNFLQFIPILAQTHSYSFAFVLNIKAFFLQWDFGRKIASLIFLWNFLAAKNIKSFFKFSLKNSFVWLPQSLGKWWQLRNHFVLMQITSIFFLAPSKIWLFKSDHIDQLQSQNA
jgi:hypothetical protein